MGDELPERIANAPKLLDGLDLYFTAFVELSTCRAYASGIVGPIPWTAIRIYADSWGIVGDTFQLMEFYLREMDTVYLKHVTEKLKKATGGNKNGTGVN